MTDENSWRTSTFRQSVVAKIDEAIRQSGMNTSRNSIEMENHVFQKAKNKEEYLGFVARLILHVREMKPKQGGGMSVPGQGQGGPGMPDPINALQNLASQGTRNSMMAMGQQTAQMGGPQQAPATNLLQTLNRGPNQQMMMGMPGNMPMQTWQDSRSKRKVNGPSVNISTNNNNNSMMKNNNSIKHVEQQKNSGSFKIHCINELDEFELDEMINDEKNGDALAIIVEELETESLIERKSNETIKFDHKSKTKDTEIATDVARIKSITSEENKIKKKYYEEKLEIMKSYQKEKLKKLDKLIEIKNKKCNILEKISETLEKLR